MKKLAIVLAGGLALGFLGMNPAKAERVDTPVGYASTDEPGYTVVAEGNDDNPGPIAGYVTVSDTGVVCADDNGNHVDGGTSPTCSQ